MISEHVRFGWWMSRQNDIPWLTVTLEPYHNIIIDRAVSVKEGEVVDNVSRISCCPVDKLPKNQYSRCSLPSQTVFYGSLFFPEVAEGEIGDPRFISIAETSSLLWSDEDGEESYVFGNWRVIHPLSCVIVVDPLIKYSVKFLDDSAKAFKEALVRNHVLGRTYSLISAKVKTFIKRSTKRNDYEDSAKLASSLFSNPDVDAIIYPSVKTDYEGCCIAIKKQSIDDGKIQLANVTLSSAKKIEKEFVFKDLQRTDIIQSDGSFHLEDV